MKAGKVTGWIQAGLFLLLLTLFLSSSRISLGMSGSQPPVKVYPGINTDVEIDKVMLVLGDKIEGERAAEKAKEKLMNLNDLQTRLLVSLSEIVALGDPAPVAGIAFLLMTVLIICS